ncbi:4Fe-4S ferredoxin, partial [Pseudorhodobacter sp.]|uniref:4Fe-4S ferredoxin n=1 Tax=Pseudorhodobacter sp. TaxID=1934400 RepID=UPI002647AFF8
MSTDAIQEARRQTEICNACRYCEGFCSVFPALTRQKVFADGDISHLANLCHNCRGCYYSCQYTEPHEFALNFPAALAEVRQESWERLAWPQPLARRFHESGVAMALAAVVAFAFAIVLMQMLRPASGDGFYAYLAHGAMVAVFAPAFVLPLASVAISLRRYWVETGGARLPWRNVIGGFRAAASLKNLNGGQGQGCNFEREDRYSDMRRWLHQAVMYGFLLCFAATSSGTILHYM